MRVLVVEDHTTLADRIAQGLRQAGMAVDAVYDGAAALEAAGEADPLACAADPLAWAADPALGLGMVATPDGLGGVPPHAASSRERAVEASVTAAVRFMPGVLRPDG